MAPTRPAHQILTGRLARLLDEALDERETCSVRIEAPILAPDGEDTVHIADLAVTCEEHRSEQRHTVSPVVILEILSPTTEIRDRRVKLPDYRRIESIQEIVFLAQDQLYAEAHRRFDSDRWQIDLLQTKEARLRLESLGFDQPLQTVYRRIELSDPDRG